MPEITVIVPVYNVEKYLRRCVDSVLAQTFMDYELILVDDGSPDNCGAICDEYAARDARVRVIHKENGGVSSARNVGLDAATGAYIFFLDSDDYLPSNVFEDGMRICGGNDLIMFGYDRVREKGVIFEKILSHSLSINKSNLTESDYLALLENDYISGACAKMLSAELIGSSRFDQTMVFGEDLCFIMSLLDRSENTCALDQIGYHYYANPQSATSTITPAKCRSALKTYRFLYTFAEKHGFDEASVFRCFVDERWRRDFLAMLRQIQGSPCSKREKRNMLRSICSDPFLAKRARAAMRRDERLLYGKTAFKVLFPYTARVAHAAKGEAKKCLRRLCL